MYVKVRVYPKSKKEKIEETGENRFDVHVKELAKDNRANERMIEMMARHFSVNKSAIRIINGHHSPSKLLSVTSS